MPNVITHCEIHQSSRVLSGELNIATRLEADLDAARRTGTVEDVFLTLEEIYSMYTHTENEGVRAKCEALLRAGVPAGVFS